MNENSSLLFGLAAGTLLAYEGIKCLKDYLNKRRNAEFVPVGTVKSLHIYPLKSGKPHDSFSYFCSPTGPIEGELRDRSFIVIDGKTGRFYTARQKPQLVLLETEIKDNLMMIKAPNSRTVHIDLNSVRKLNDVRKAYLFDKTRTDGLDCGQDIASFLSDYIEEPNTRLLLFDDKLFTERTCVTQNNWWNNPVPKRRDEIAYADLSPYMIMNQASIDDLNEKLENKVSSRNFRPVILVDKSKAFDEDRWAEIRIGDVELQCFCPCTRCVLTTVDPATGVKSNDMQPLKKLREYRLAPEGKMRNEFKDSPCFGVCAGVNKTGYIHVGQTVYARYKPSTF